MIHHRFISILLPCIFLIFSACADDAEPDTSFEYTPEEAAEEFSLGDEQLAFWDNIQEHCGNAYEGKLADATPYYADDIDADYIAIHVRDCTETLTHISLHLDDDHSRNLMLTKVEGTLQLKHDHRNKMAQKRRLLNMVVKLQLPGLKRVKSFTLMSTPPIFFLNDLTISGF